MNAKLALYRTEALIIRSKKYMEANSILTILSKERGKIIAIAKGSRKTGSKLRGGVQPFTVNEMLLAEGRNWDVVSQSHCVEAFTPMHEDIKAITAAAYWGELLDVFTVPGETDEEIYNIALAGFHVLNLSTSESTVRAMEIKLLDVLGFAPCLDKCVICGREITGADKVYFSAPSGGSVCQNCTSSDRTLRVVEFSHEALNVWQQMMKMELGKSGRVKMTFRGSAILENVLALFLLEQTEYPTKSREIMLRMLRDQ